MSEQIERIRAAALAEAMLALGVKEMTVQRSHLQAVNACEVSSVIDMEQGTIRYTLRRPVVIEGSFKVVEREFS